jgi:hypothetical protein
MRNAFFIFLSLRSTPLDTFVGLRCSRALAASSSARRSASLLS